MTAVWPIRAAAAAGQWVRLPRYCGRTAPSLNPIRSASPRAGLSCTACRNARLRLKTALSSQPSPRSNQDAERVLTTRSPRGDGSPAAPPWHGGSCPWGDPRRHRRQFWQNAIPPFCVSEISALQRGFRAAPLERPCPAAGMSIRWANGRPPASLASGPRPCASRQSGGSYRSLETRAGYCTTPVPQRRCMKRSHGANRVLSVTSPMMIITSMIPITWSMALSSRP